MKTIFKWLVPGFMRRLDRFLLENYPVVWRTRGHYVLFYSFLLIPVLFALGFAYSVSVANLTVDPYNHIIFFYDPYNKGMLVLFSIGLLYWAYTQYQTGFSSTRLKDIFLTLGIYSVGIFAMLAITTPMFRLGTILRTAYFFIDEKDLNNWARQDFYRYGFVFNDSDSFNIPPNKLTTYFQEREKDLATILKIENTILKRRYDIAYIDSIGIAMEQDLKRRSIGIKNSFTGFLHHYGDRSYIPRPGIHFGSFLPMWDYWAYLPQIEKKTENSGPRNQNRLPNFRSYRSFRYFELFRIELEEEKYRMGRQDWRLLALYNNYYFLQKNPVFPGSVIEKYGIPVGLDTVPLDTFILVKPQCPIALENAYNSVQHARQFIREGIQFWHYKTLFYYLPFITLLLFAAPFLSFRMALGALTVGAVGTLFNISLDFNSAFLKYWYYWHTLVYLALPLTGLLLLIYSAMLRKHMPIVSFAFHLIVLGLVMILFLALYGDKGIFNTTALTISKPVNLAFFGMQVIGLTGVLLRTYLQALPRR